MTKSVFTLLAFFCCATAMAQFTIDDINKPSNIDDTLVFPVLRSELHPEAAKKINKTLQLAELGLEVGPGTKDPLASIYEDTYYYTVLTNNAYMFSLEITTGHVGAGSHFRSIDYLFDAHTGDKIDPNGLFTASGKTKVKQMMYKRWKEAIKANVSDQYNGQTYKDCLVEAEKITEVEILRMGVKENGIVAFGGGCLDGSIPNDPAFGPFTISFEELLTALTPYGVSLFIGSPESPASLPRALMKGKIDSKYNITLTFIQSDASGSVKGVIVYDRINSPIPISGTMTDNKIVFHEMDPANAPVSDIECTWDGKDLVGSFKNRKANKLMTFAATKIL
jgi:hypothetical protein